MDVSAAPGVPPEAPAIAASQDGVSAIGRMGAKSQLGLDAADMTYDVTLAPRSSDPLVRRLEFLASPGVPVRVQAGETAVDLFWPYAPGSRNGGPDKLASQGLSESFRDHMAPVAAYFGAGTRGPMMAWLGDQASRGQLAAGSPATQGLQAIANTLFWDIPMQQTSDDRLIARGMPVDLSTPEAMAAYLRHQRDAIAALIPCQTPEADGSAYMRAGRELGGMVEAALSRVEGFMAGALDPVTATPLGPFGWYNHAAEPSAAAPLSAEIDPAATPADLRETAQRLEQDLLG